VYQNGRARRTLHGNCKRRSGLSKRTESQREATIEANRQKRRAAEKNKKQERALRRLGIEPAAISEVAYKIIRADLQAARELYRILVAGGGDAACRYRVDASRDRAAPSFAEDQRS
jgi:hypothetical protein